MKQSAVLFPILSACAFAACTMSEPRQTLPDFAVFSPTDDGGNDQDLSNATDDGSVDASKPPPQGTLLSAGDIDIIDVLPDNTIIYLRNDTKTSLEAIPLAGGTPTVLDADLKLSSPAAATDDSFQVSGGVVGLWTGVDAMGNAKLQVWTPANGMQTAAASAPAADVIAGSSDGTRVAFIRKNAANDELVISLTTFAVASPPVVVQATLGRGSAATACDPDFTFAGQFLVSATCSGAGTTATLRRTTDVGPPLQIVTARAPIVRVDDAADKVFSWTRPGSGRVYSISATNVVTSVAVDTGISQGVISPDGKTLVYQTTGGALKSAPVAATITPVTLIAAGGVNALQGISPDFANVVSSKLAPDANGNVDLQWSTVGVAAAPTVLVAAATGALNGFTATGSDVFYTPDTSAPALKVRALMAGSTEVNLGAVFFAQALPASTKVLIAANLAQETVGGNMVDVGDVRILDVAAAAAAFPLVTAVQLDFRAVADKLVFVQAGDGLYAKSLP